MRTTTQSHALPMLDADVFLTDGGIETTLIFEDGFDLPDFAAFTLLGDPAGRDALDLRHSQRRRRSRRTSASRGRAGRSRA